MGKSTELRPLLAQTPKQLEDRILYRDLGQYQTDFFLNHDIFENPEFLSWQDGGHRLYLILDSFDEGLLSIPSLVKLLARRLESLPVERLCLRIACRAAEWPSGLGNTLMQLWGEDSYQIYQLAPLRRSDVEEAASASGIDATAFLQNVDRTGVAALATKPVTLRFLLGQYSQTGRLPLTQADLYLQGCRRLCEETSESRRDAGRTGNLDPDRRLVLAARIAAATIFANRYAIWTGVDLGTVPDTDIVIAQLTGGREAVKDATFESDEAAIQETLRTGLFSAAGAHRLRWAHHTYAEFLAAHYLVHHELSLPQIMSLIQADDAEGKIVPQLYETAAWLGGQVPAVLDRIMEIDPEVLLRSDVVIADPKTWGKLVDQLLSFYDAEELFPRHWNFRDGMSRLRSSELAERLRFYITDKTKQEGARYFAIAVAEACDVGEVQGELAALVLDMAETIRLRVRAAWAVSRMGDLATRARLAPLAIASVAVDPQDDLKGLALRSCWPDILDAASVFAALTLPQRQNYIGAYEGFLSRDLVAHLRPADLAVALAWVETTLRSGSLSFSFERPILGILSFAWQHLQYPDVLPAFARATLAAIRSHWVSSAPRLKDGLGALWSADEEQRKRLISEFIALIGDPDDASSLAFFYSLVRSEDLLYLLQLLAAHLPSKAQTNVAKLVRLCYDPNHAAHTNAVLMACGTNDILAEEFRWLWEPVRLGSPEALRMKALHEDLARWSQPKAEPPPLTPSPAERIVSRLEAFDSGELRAWWVLNLDMTLEPNGSCSEGEWESDLTALPGWRDASPVVRARLLAAAERYVLDYEPGSSVRADAGHFERPALAGYRAFRLLTEQAPDVATNLPSHVWRRWAPIIVEYPLYGADPEQEVHRLLFSVAYSVAPDAVIQTLLDEIDRECGQGGYLMVITKLGNCWDDRLQATMLDKAQDPTLKPECMAALLSCLLERSMPEARSLAETLVASIGSDDNADEEARAVKAAIGLILHTPDAGWATVWPAILSSPKFGRKIIEEIAGRHGPGPDIWQRLNEVQLADLYIWLEQQYPHSEDPQPDGYHAVTIREEVAQWRDAVLRSLRLAGTQDACDAITRIWRQFPELAWLRQVLDEARRVRRRSAWNPPQPEHVVRLARDASTRLIMSGDQLLDVIVESLGRLQIKLQGETPQAPLLWDKIRHGVYRPKDENMLSDYIKVHFVDDLQRRGIIANREVVIRQGLYPGKGERTDIHIDAVSPTEADDEFKILTAIIEVKGCWNQELRHAMKAQLVNRYLRDSPCHHGLYLVGWFICPQWDPRDYRRSDVRHWNLAEAASYLDAQAADLSRGQDRIRSYVLNTALR